MSTGTPRCVYCSKPTRSHAIAIAPGAYADAYDDSSFDADHGTYVAAVCHGCWTTRDESALAELVDTPSSADGADGSPASRRLSEAARTAIRQMNHEHVRFDLDE